jgi:predicted lipoprotein with Yx(FWY)xxD motif
MSFAVLVAAGAVASALALLLSITLAARPASAKPASASAAAVTSIGLRKTGLGRLLVNSRGFTLYAFSRDGGGTDRCVQVRGCTGVWPVLRATGRPVAGGGVEASLLGTIGLPGGVRQVTYAGHPLYTYAFDNAPAQTGYVGASQFGGVWRALTASGKLIG